MMLLSHTNYHTVHHHGPRQNRFTGGGTDCTVFSEGFFSTEVNVDPTVGYCTLHGMNRPMDNYHSTIDQQAAVHQQQAPTSIQKSAEYCIVLY